MPRSSQVDANACLEMRCPGIGDCGHTLGPDRCFAEYPCLCAYAPFQVDPKAMLDACGENSCMAHDGTCCPAGSGWVVNGRCHDKQLTAYELCQSSGGKCPDSVVCNTP